MDFIGMKFVFLHNDNSQTMRENMTLEWALGFLAATPSILFKYQPMYQISSMSQRLCKVEGRLLLLYAQNGEMVWWYAG